MVDISKSFELSRCVCSSERIRHTCIDVSDGIAEPPIMGRKFWDYHAEDIYPPKREVTLADSTEIPIISKHGLRAKSLVPR